MTSNEQLVKLYRSTNDIKLKEKIYIEIYDKNIGLAKKMINRKCKMNISDAIKDIHAQDLYQEAKIALSIALDKYEEIHDGKPRRFSTYFSWLINSRMDHFMREQVYPQMSNDIHIDLVEAENNYISGDLATNKTHMEMLQSKSTENTIDNIIICDNINMCIKKIKFKEEWHERVFRYKFGLNENKIFMKERELADIFNVSQQRIGFICKNYKDKLKIIILEHIKNGYSAEDFGLTEI